MAGEQLEDLAQRANLGDERAAASFIGACLPYWMGAARDIAAPQLRDEAEDLVQGSIAKLLELWRRGEGPSRNTRAYVTASIRNAHATQARSPRSRSRSLDDQALEPGGASVQSPDNTEFTDLTYEREAIREAIDLISPDHRAVLIATVVEGRKPGDLVEALDRPAPAVSNLIARAKQALRRALLVVYLSRGGAECSHNARELPRQVLNELDDHEDSERGIAHARSCNRCRRNWRRFAAVTTALGVLPLLTVAQLTAGAEPAAADDTDPDAGDRGEDGSQAAPSAGLGAIQGGAGSAAAVPGTVGAFTKALATPLALAIGILFVVVALIAVLLQLRVSAQAGEESVYTGEISGDNPHSASFVVHLGEASSGDTRTVVADFAVRDAAEWSISDLTLSLPGGSELLSNSKNLNCSASEQGVWRCLTDGVANRAGPFEFLVRSPEGRRGSFALDLLATADGDAFTGRATGTW